MDIEKELMNIVKMKKGSSEFALFYFDESDDWDFELGNDSYSVCLGEVSGEVSVSGETLVDVISKMKSKLRLEA